VNIRPRSFPAARLLGHKISAGEVSPCSKKLVQAIEDWPNRDLSAMKLKYLFCDGHSKTRG